MKKTIGILTWHYFHNFGSALQTYALFTTLKKFSDDVSVINYRNTCYSGLLKFKPLRSFKTFIQYLLTQVNFPGSEHWFVNARLFRMRHLKQSKEVNSGNELQILAKNYDVIVYGSDQIWAPNVFNSIYMGDYVPNIVKKISYAASVGLNNIPSDMVELYKRLLLDYQSVSVRESEGKNLLESVCGIKADVVLDPTLLLDANDYRRIEKKVKSFNLDKPFIFCYFLNNNHNYKKYIESFAAKFGDINIIGISENERDHLWMNTLEGIGADQFVWLIDNARFVFTDSYHGSIFSLLFHKELYILKRFKENDPVCQNSRIRQLMDYFNIHHRLVDYDSDVNEIQSIDYHYFDKELTLLRDKSFIYLKNALEKC